MEDLPDEPPPPLPPPFAPPEADISTVNRIAQYIAQAKKATKRVVQISPDEAMDRMLADHERRAAKKKKRMSPDEAMDLQLAEHEKRAAKKKKQVTPDEAMDLLLAEHDSKQHKFSAFVVILQQLASKATVGQSEWKLSL